MSDAEAEKLSESFLLNSYCQLACTVLLLHDIIITFDLEIACIWRRKPSLITAIFAGMRYLTLVSLLTGSVAVLVPTGYMSCRIVAYVASTTELSSRIVFMIFSSLRIWVIYGRNPIFLWGTLVLCLSSPAINILELAISKPYRSVLHEPLGGCSWHYSSSISNQLHLGIAARACAILADTHVVIVTCLKTWSVRKVLNKTLTIQQSVSVSDVLMRDSIVSFSVLFALNVICLVFDCFPKIIIFNPGPIFIDELTSILLTRLILNLRSHTSSTTTVSSSPSSLYFNHTFDISGGVEEERITCIRLPLHNFNTVWASLTKSGMVCSDIDCKPFVVGLLENAGVYTTAGAAATEAYD